LGATLSQPRTLKGKAPSAPSSAASSKKYRCWERLYGFGGTKSRRPWGSATCPNGKTPRLTRALPGIFPSTVLSRALERPFVPPAPRLAIFLLAGASKLVSLPNRSLGEG